MHFDEAVQYLLDLGHETLAIKLGLRNTELLLQELNSPEHYYPAVQIAGTNGKGSTATFLDSICRAAGIKTGLYTSPHLVSITERIRLNGTPLTPEAFAIHTTAVRSAAEQLLTDAQIEALPTFFEQVTVVALLAFREAGIELAILETGLGGRLDSTSAAEASIVALTPIAFDHEEYLGNTLEEIAGEKAAIIRHGARAVVAKQDPRALNAILRRCREVDVEPLLDGCRSSVDEVTSDGRFRVSFETASEKYEKVLLGLRGRHQIENAAVAIQLAELLRPAGLQISHSAIVAGVQSAVHAGRLELVPHAPPILLDGAHNPAGATALREYLDEFVSQPLTLIFGAMRDKRLEEIAEILFPAADRLVLTTIENPRAASTEMLYTIARRFVGAEKITLAASAREAVNIAQKLTDVGGLICVTGSLYLIGEIRPVLHL